MRGLTDRQRLSMSLAASGDWEAAIRVVDFMTDEERQDTSDRYSIHGSSVESVAFVVRVDAAARAAGLWPVRP